MEVIIKATLKMIYLKEKEFLYLDMGIFMKVILKIIYLKEKEFINMNGRVSEDEF